MATNPYLPFLEDNPNILYQSLMPQRQNRNFMDYWRSQYGDMYNNYLGNLGRQAWGGQAPTLNFSDYLGNFDWEKNWGNLAPRQRGEQNPYRMAWNVRP